MSGGNKFDAHAAHYLALHKAAVAASGEDSDYFAHYKIACLNRLLGHTWNEPVLDFGCGVGLLTEPLVVRFAQVTGFDPSTESLAQARKRVPRATFVDALDAVQDSHFGLAILSGVLHHVPPPERSALLRQLLSKLTPGNGRLVVFEHNPWNPLTRRAVAACSFDDGAILLGPFEARRLLASSGFTNVNQRFIVFFPAALAWLRFLEPYLGAVPIGAQVMLVGSRPGGEPS